MAEPIRNKRPERIRLGDLLVQQKLISQEQLRRRARGPKPVGKKAGPGADRQRVSLEDQIGEALARQLGVRSST